MDTHEWKHYYQKADSIDEIAGLSMNKMTQ